MMSIHSVTHAQTRLPRSPSRWSRSSPAAHGQQPSAAAMATAKELVAITGATSLFNPLIAGVVEQAKLLYLQQNPALAKDLNEIADKMRDRSGAALLPN